MHVTLTKSLDKFVAGQLVEGHYSSANEVVIEGHQLLEEREAKLNKLRTLLDEGKNSVLLSGKEAMKNIRTTLLKKHGV